MTKLVPLGQKAWINPPTELPQGTNDSSTFTFVPMASVSEHGQLQDVGLRPYNQVNKGYTLFQKDDVLLAKITPCMENGKAALTDKLPTMIGFGSTEFHVLRAKPTNHPRFLFHMVWNSRFRSEASRNMTGSAGQKRVPKNFLERFEIPDYSYDEQKRIAAVLDKADALRRKRQEALRLTDDFLRSTFLDLFGDPATNPKEHPRGTIRDLVECANYGTSEKAHLLEEGYPVLRMNNITYEGGWNFSSLKYVNLDSLSAHKYLVHKGQILFNRTNSKELVGKTAVYRKEEPMAYAGYLIRVTPKATSEAEYISAYLNSQHGKAVLLGMCKSIVGMANINAQEMLSIPILLPPTSLQKHFGDVVRYVEQKRVSQIDALNTTETLFSALQQRAFSGEL